MTKREKRLEKMHRNPKNIRKAVLDSVLQDFDFTPDFTSGSHVTYRHPSGARITVVAHGAHVPTYIVKQALKAIDRVSTADDNDDNSEGMDDGEND